MGVLLERLAGRRKDWSQPPFWALDAPVWSTPTGDKERVANDFAGYVRDAYKASGVIFTCALVRLQVFSQVRFRLEDATGAL